MSSPIIINRYWTVTLIILTLTLGLTVMFISLTRAGMSVIGQRIYEKKCRVNPINYEKVGEEGQKVASCYYLPAVNLLPGHPLYPIKSARDKLWLYLAKDKEEKIRTALFLADKKAAEAARLVEIKEDEKAEMTLKKAFGQLQYADGLINNLDEENDEIKQVHKELYGAGLAYSEIGRRLGKRGAGEDSWLRDLDKWNEEQKNDEENK